MLLIQPGERSGKMIVAENLSKSYSGHRAIEDISFKIRAGEIVGLLGLNGAGKSTILKILGCFLLPSGGKASIDGYSVDQSPQEIRKRIGYLPDHPPLYDEMTVEAYLTYVAKLKNVPAGDVTARVREVMSKTNTDRVAGARLGELSHGYRQRVGIGQAMVHNPSVLILDEPINGLDPVQIVEMRDLITSLRGRHTVVLSSHILSEITRTCDRILIVDRGRLVAEGSEAELSSRMAQNARILADVTEVPPGLLDRMQKLAGVASVAEAPGFGGTRRLTIDVTGGGDVRAMVAETCVQAGAGLVGLTRAEGGLESLFMKLIKPVETRQ
jgi:ABC-2 type transport system ATP-binding protein